MSHTMQILDPYSHTIQIFDPITPRTDKPKEGPKPSKTTASAAAVANSALANFSPTLETVFEYTTLQVTKPKEGPKPSNTTASATAVARSALASTATSEPTFAQYHVTPSKSLETTASAAAVAKSALDTTAALEYVEVFLTKNVTPDLGVALESKPVLKNSSHLQLPFGIGDSADTSSAAAKFPNLHHTIIFGRSPEPQAVNIDQTRIIIK